MIKLSERRRPFREFKELFMKTKVVFLLYITAGTFEFDINGTHTKITLDIFLLRFPFLFFQLQLETQFSWKMGHGKYTLKISNSFLSKRAENFPERNFLVAGKNKAIISLFLRSTLQFARPTYKYNQLPVSLPWYKIIKCQSLFDSCTFSSSIQTGFLFLWNWLCPISCCVHSFFSCMLIYT